MYYWFTTSSLYFTEWLYFEVFQNKPVETVKFRLYPLMNFSPTSEYYIASRQHDIGYSHGIFFPLAFTRIWSPLPLGLPRPVRSVPRFRYLSTGFFFTYLPALFHAGSAFRISPFRAFPLLSSCDASQHPLPSWCYLPSRLPCQAFSLVLLLLENLRVSPSTLCLQKSIRKKRSSPRLLPTQEFALI